MNNGLAFVVLSFALSGLILIPLTINETFGEQPVDKPQACNNEQAKHVGNKHCDDDNGGSGDPVQLTSCDTDLDGTIDAGELAAIGVLNPTQIIKAVDANDSGDIDTKSELRDLNQLLRVLGYATCK